MKKLIIAATLAVAATPLLAQQTSDNKSGQDAAAEGCAMAGERGARTEHHAEMQKHMQELHARMGTHEGRNQGRSKLDEQHQH